MNRRAINNFISKRSNVWTLGLCMTGILLLGGLTAVNRMRDGGTEIAETEIGQEAYLEEELPQDAEDELFPTIGRTDDEEMAQASNIITDQKESVGNVEMESEKLIPETENMDQEVVSDSLIEDQVSMESMLRFSEDDTLLWPSAGTVLIDYSMDGSVYFPTLNEYKYNPALIIGSEVGNQVLASAKGIVESIGIDEETGNTLVLNIGDGYRLTYGQLKELVVSEGDIVEEGALLGYISEPTRYYIEEGSNLYYAMTKDGNSVDPILYLE